MDLILRNKMNHKYIKKLSSINITEEGIKYLTLHEYCNCMGLDFSAIKPMTDWGSLKEVYSKDRYFVLSTKDYQNYCIRHNVPQFKDKDCIWFVITEKGFDYIAENIDNAEFKRRHSILKKEFFHREEELPNRDVFKEECNEGQYKSMIFKMIALFVSYTENATNTSVLKAIFNDLNNKGYNLDKEVKNYNERHNANYFTLDVICTIKNIRIETTNILIEHLRELKLTEGDAVFLNKLIKRANILNDSFKEA